MRQTFPDACKVSAIAAHENNPMGGAHFALNSRDVVGRLDIGFQRRAEAIGIETRPRPARKSICACDVLGATMKKCSFLAMALGLLSCDIGWPHEPLVIYRPTYSGLP